MARIPRNQLTREEKEQREIERVQKRINKEQIGEEFAPVLYPSSSVKKPISSFNSEVIKIIEDLDITCSSLLRKKFTSPKEAKDFFEEHKSRYQPKIQKLLKLAEKEDKNSKSIDDILQYMNKNASKNSIFSKLLTQDLKTIKEGTAIGSIANILFLTTNKLFYPVIDRIISNKELIKRIPYIAALQYDDISIFYKEQALGELTRLIYISENKDIDIDPQYLEELVNRKILEVDLTKTYTKEEQDLYESLLLDGRTIESFHHDSQISAYTGLLLCLISVVLSVVFIIYNSKGNKRILSLIGFCLTSLITMLSVTTTNWGDKNIRSYSDFDFLKVILSSIFAIITSFLLINKSVNFIKNKKDNTKRDKKEELEDNLENSIKFFNHLSKQLKEIEKKSK